MFYEKTAMLFTIVFHEKEQFAVLSTESQVKFELPKYRKNFTIDGNFSSGFRRSE